MNLFKDNYAEKLTLALGVTGLAFLYIFIAEEILNYLVASKVPFVAVLQEVGILRAYQETVTNFEVFPIITFWLLVGVVAYFFYYSLSSIYITLENSARIQLYFTKPSRNNADPSRRLRLLRRLSVHLAVILAYVLLVVLGFFFLAPFLVVITKSILALSAAYLPLPYDIYLSIFFVFSFSYILIAYIFFFAGKARERWFVAELEDCHGQANC